MERHIALPIRTYYEWLLLLPQERVKDLETQKSQMELSRMMHPVAPAHAPDTAAPNAMGQSYGGAGSTDLQLPLDVISIQSSLVISIWSVAPNAIHLSKYPFIEQPLPGDIQFCPSRTHPLVELSTYRVCLY